MVSYIVIGVVSLLLLVADQVVKVIIDSNLVQNGDGIVVIGNFFSITNVHNKGAAWGVFQDATIPLAILSVLMAAVVLYVFIQADSNLVKLSAALIFVGAIGNVIDRFRLGYVVDFLHFYNLFGFYDFPTFNIADICVTSGVIGLIIYFIFCSRKKNAFRQGTRLHRWFYEKKTPEEGKGASEEPDSDAADDTAANDTAADDTDDTKNS